MNLFSTSYQRINLPSQETMPTFPSEDNHWKNTPLTPMTSSAKSSATKGKVELEELPWLRLPFFSCLFLLWNFVSIPPLPLSSELLFFFHTLLLSTVLINQVSMSIQNIIIINLFLLHRIFSKSSTVFTLSIRKCLVDRYCMYYYMSTFPLIKNRRFTFVS